ncbi:MAG TPA: extracellular solute-binding protein [Phycisphaerae bacterium]|nr:extracellular solute-binding protein [Phycisphaerae bacterium]
MRSGRSPAFLLFTIAATMAGLLTAGLSCSRGSTPSTPRVVLYCSADRVYAEPIIAEYEKATGVDVLALYDSEDAKTVGLAKRIRAEARAPVADVFWSSEVFHTVRLAREGLLAPYAGAETADWPRHFKDPDGLWHGFALRARVIAFHTGRVKADEAPRRLEDLLDARWKGRIAMAKPLAGTTQGDVASWFVHYGPQRAEEMLRGLKANQVKLVAGNSAAVRMLSEGRADVCLTDSDDVYSGQRNGWSIAFHYLDQGGAGALVIPNTAAMIKGGPDPEQGRKLMAFLLGGQVERRLAASDSHNTPVRLDVAEVDQAYRIPRQLEVDYGQVADHLPTAVEKGMEILR